MSENKTRYKSYCLLNNLQFYAIIAIVPLFDVVILILFQQLINKSRIGLINVATWQTHLWSEVPCIAKSFLSTWEYIYPLLDLSNLFYSYVPFCSFSFSKVHVNITFSIVHIMINQFIYQERVSITRVTRHHLHNSQDFTRQCSTE